MNKSNSSKSIQKLDAYRSLNRSTHVFDSLLSKVENPTHAEGRTDGPRDEWMDVRIEGRIDRRAEMPFHSDESCLKRRLEQRQRHHGRSFKRFKITAFFSLINFAWI